MRLSNKEIQIIVDVAKSSFGENTHVTLFGSRLNDLGKGGDIDLLIVEDSSEDYDLILKKKLKFLADLELLLGEQKVDLLVKHKNDNRSIIKTAERTGIVLC